MQSFQLSPVFHAGRHDINARCVDIAVTENICQLGNISLHRIKRPGEELPQIVWKHFVRIYVCFRAKSFHGRPDIASVHGLSGSCAENDA